MSPSMWRELGSITSMDQVPMVPLDPWGVNPTSWKTASTRLLGTNT